MSTMYNVHEYIMHYTMYNVRVINRSMKLTLMTTKPSLWQSSSFSVYCLFLQRRFSFIVLSGEIIRLNTCFPANRQH